MCADAPRSRVYAELRHVHGAFLLSGGVASNGSRRLKPWPAWGSRIEVSASMAHQGVKAIVEKSGLREAPDVLTGRVIGIEGMQERSAACGRAFPARRTKPDRHAMCRYEHGQHAGCMALDMQLRRRRSSIAMEIDVPRIA